MSSQINELWKSADQQEQNEEEVKQQALSQSSSTPGLVESTGDPSQDFIRSLAAQCLGNQLKIKTKEYLKYLDNLIKEQFEKLIKNLEERFNEFPSDFQNEIVSHETAQNARERVMRLENELRFLKRKEFTDIINKSLKELHIEIILDEMINREILYNERF